MNREIRFQIDENVNEANGVETPDSNLDFELSGAKMTLD